MPRLTHLPLHPLLLAAAFVLQPAALNGVEPPGFVRPLVVSVAVAAIVTVAAAAAVRGWIAGGLLATSLFLLTISREPILAALALLRDALGPNAIVGLGVLVAAAAWILAIAGVSLARQACGRQWHFQVTRALNLFGVALVGAALVFGASTTVRWVGAAPAGNRNSSAPPRAQPDIVVLLLDGYPRADELERQFGYDNGAFLAELEALGFNVDASSHSNYTYSALTFTAMFEIGHAIESAQGSVQDGELRDRLHRALTGGPAVRALHEAGYEIATTAAGWEHDSMRSRIDRFIDRPELTDFERQVLQRTWVLDLPLVTPGLYFEELHNRVDGILTDAVALAGEEGRTHPVFGFVHVPAPHLPMAFGADGGPAPFTSRQYGAGRPSEFGLSAADYRSAYGASITELNRRVVAAIEQIREAENRRAAPLPVIVVMSDHGYISDDPDHGVPMLRNLFAAALPGATRPWGDAPTPVNLIPALLDAYGNPAPARSPDRFFTTVIDDGLQLTEIREPPTQ